MLNAYYSLKQLFNADTKFQRYQYKTFGNFWVNKVKKKHQFC